MSDTVCTHSYLPAASERREQLLLADSGYIEQRYCSEIERHSGFYLVRGKKFLNPTIEEARSRQGRLLPKLAEKWLNLVDRGTDRSKVPDRVVSSGKFRYRMIRRWFAPQPLADRADVWFCSVMTAISQRAV